MADPGSVVRSAEDVRVQASGRVLLVLGPSTGGIRRHVAALADGLERQGWEVAVAGPPGVMDGLRVLDHPLAVGRDVRAAGRAVAVLSRLVRTFDVIHAHGLTVGWLVSLVPRRPPLVLTVHNVVLDEVEGRRGGVLRRLEWRLPARVDATIAISDEVARHFSGSRGADRISVIAPVARAPEPHRPASAVRAELAVPDGVPLLVFIGRLHPQKDLATLLDAVAELQAAGRRCVVAVAGDGPERADLAVRCDALGLAEVVRFLGQRADAADLMAAADVVVMCSIWEGFGLVVVEALQLGRPLVATAVGPVPRLVVDGQTGRLVPPSSPGALATAIEALLRDPAGARRMGRAGADRVAALLGPEALVERVAAVYRRLLEAR